MAVALRLLTMTDRTARHHDQLATATDRLLFGLPNSRAAMRRRMAAMPTPPSVFPRSSSPVIVVAPQLLAPPAASPSSVPAARVHRQSTLLMFGGVLGSLACALVYLIA
jgi:hypothetical protein